LLNYCLVFSLRESVVKVSAVMVQLFNDGKRLGVAVSGDY